MWISDTFPCNAAAATAGSGLQEHIIDHSDKAVTVPFTLKHSERRHILGEGHPGNRLQRDLYSKCMDTPKAFSTKMLPAVLEGSKSNYKMPLELTIYLNLIVQCLCWSSFYYHDKIPDINNLQGILILAYDFRGFTPWLLSPIALSL